jgi:hypothetical protein
MNTDIAYKGLKYIVVWVLIYLVVKYTSSAELSEIDIALVATVLTLLLCILESMGSNSHCRPEGLLRQQENVKGLVTSGDLNITGSMNSFVDNIRGTISTNNNISVTETNELFSDSASTESSGTVSSSVSNSTESSGAVASSVSNSTESSGAVASSVSNSTESSGETSPILSDINSPNKESGIIANIMAQLKPNPPSVVQSDASENSGTIPNPSVLPVPVTPAHQGDIYRDYTSPEKNGNQPDRMYLDRDYLGQGVMFDKNEFGGTSNQSDDTSSMSDDTVPLPIAINVPKADGVFVRVDKSVVSDTVNHNSPNVNPDIGARLSPSGKPLQWYEQAFNPRSYAGADNLDQIATSGGKTRNDLLVNEMIYSDFNRLPPSFNDRDFEYGYSFLPPKDWYPLPPYPPVCVSNKNSPVQPVYLDTMTMDLKEWHETQKITPPDSINTAFVTNELNSKV